MLRFKTRSMVKHQRVIVWLLALGPGLQPCFLWENVFDTVNTSVIRRHCIKTYSVCFKSQEVVIEYSQLILIM